MCSSKDRNKDNAAAERIYFLQKMIDIKEKSFFFENPIRVMKIDEKLHKKC